MFAALRALPRLGSIGAAAAAAATLQYGPPATRCEQKRRFDGKTIVITGGGGTFGRVGAASRLRRLSGSAETSTRKNLDVDATKRRYFSREGANVVLVDVNQKALDETLAGLDATTVKACACDVRDAAAVAAVVQTASEHFGGVDLLWNNAGYQGQMKPLLDYSAADVQAVMDINVVGAFNVLQACAKNMAARGGGVVVQTGSVAGLRGTPTMAAYVASKAAVHGLTMTAAKDLAPHKIRVNTVMPALIGPEDGYMWKRQNELHAASGSPYFGRDAAALAAKKVAGVPLKRLGEVEEVVEAVAFLLSDDSSYVTGTSLVIAGGMA